VTDPALVPAEVLRRAQPIPTYRDHPATVGHDLVGVDPSGARLSVGIAAGAEPVCVLFLSSSCQGCRDLWEGTGALRRDLGPAVRVVVVTRGPEAEDAAAVARLATSGAVGSDEVSGETQGGETGSGGTEVTEVVMSSQAYLDYGVSGPPFYALTVGTDVRTEGVAWGVRETAQAVRRALAGPDSP
jgi:hypothetical protein